MYLIEREEETGNSLEILTRGATRKIETFAEEIPCRRFREGPRRCARIYANSLRGKRWGNP
jgi:hypothetical protein